MSLVLKTAPTVEPVTVTELKLHSRISQSVEDAALAIFIAAAREAIQNEVARSLIQQTWTLYLPDFPPLSAGVTGWNSDGDDTIYLPFPPVSSVTSVKYLDPSTGVLTTLVAGTDYTTLLPSGDYAGPGEIYPVYGGSWPSVRDIRNAVQIEFVAGYGAADTAVPKTLKEAVLLVAGHLYEHREENIVVGGGMSIAELPLGVSQLVSRFVVREVVHT